MEGTKAEKYAELERRKKLAESLVEIDNGLGEELAEFKNEELVQ